jgi:uncharacterized protein YukJ
MAGLDKGYGVLCGRVIQARTERDDTRSPHFQILVHAAGESFRVAVNVQSVDGSELVYYLDEDFRHPALDLLLETEEGFTRLESAAGGLALDYIRGNHFAPADMRELPADVGGPDNDLNDLLKAHVGRAVTDPEAILFAFGEPWGPDPGKDKVFRFSPNRGIHNIHQNQGNSGNFAGENGVWQDGGLMLCFRARAVWSPCFSNSRPSPRTPTTTPAIRSMATPAPKLRPPVVPPRSASSAPGRARPERCPPAWRS